MIKTLTTFTAVLFLSSSIAFAEETLTVKDAPAVVQHLGQSSGLFPHVNDFFRRGPMTTWAVRGPANPWGNPSDSD
jgi:hypothetical protein